ncbi:hypothetical protein ACEPAH_5581 [Sanghuangporus vaninii]
MGLSARRSVSSPPYTSKAPADMSGVLHYGVSLPSEVTYAIPFKTENSAATIFWALTNASLGAYIAFGLLPHSREHDVSLKCRIVWIVLAAFALTFGCCACQLSTARIHLQSLEEGDTGAFISFKIGFIILSVFVATLLVVSAFSLLDRRLSAGRTFCGFHALPTVPFLTVFEGDFHASSSLSGPSARRLRITLFSSRLKFPH